jgi:hypothetical protein
MSRNQIIPVGLVSLIILFLCAAAPPDCRGQKTVAPDNYADLGNPDDEKFHDLRGWGDTSGDLPRASGLDLTSRYQRLRASNSVKLFIGQPNVPYTLSFRSEAGLCDDSFEVYVNSAGPLYVYKNKEAAGLKGFHQLTVDASVITDTTVDVTFRNIAADSCGHAAIGFVELEPVNASGITSSQVSPRTPAINLLRAVDMAELFAEGKKVDLTSYTLTEAQLVEGNGDEKYWKLRWEHINARPYDYLEFKVSMDGTVSYRRSKESMTR